MAWRYRDRETKTLASYADYRRSVTQGGTRFERFSDATWRVKGRKPEGSDEIPKGGTFKALPPSQAPRDYYEWEQAMMGQDFEEAEYDTEYETGVDY